MTRDAQRVDRRVKMWNVRTRQHVLRSDADKGHMSKSSFSKWTDICSSSNIFRNVLKRRTDKGHMSKFKLQDSPYFVGIFINKWVTLIFEHVPFFIFQVFISNLQDFTHHFCRNCHQQVENITESLAAISENCTFENRRGHSFHHVKLWTCF